MRIIVDDIDQVFDKIANERAIKKAMGKACALLEREAKENCSGFKNPTGDLRRSIKSKVEDSTDEITGIVYTPLDYAPYVEYGTGLFAENGDGRKDVPWHYQDEEGNWHSTNGQHPHPFLRPALDENREQVLKILKDGLIDD